MNENNKKYVTIDDMKKALREHYTDLLESKSSSRNVVNDDIDKLAIYHFSELHTVHDDAKDILSSFMDCSVLELHSDLKLHSDSGKDSYIFLICNDDSDYFATLYDKTNFRLFKLSESEYRKITANYECHFYKPGINIGGIIKNLDSIGKLDSITIIMGGNEPERRKNRGRSIEERQ